MGSTVNNKLMTFSQMQGNQVFYNNNQNVVKSQTPNHSQIDNELKTDTFIICGKEFDKKKVINTSAIIATVVSSLGALFGLASKGKNISKFVNGVSDENLKLWVNIQEGFKYSVSKLKSLWNNGEKLQCEDINNKIKAGKGKAGEVPVKSAKSNVTQSQGREPVKSLSGRQESLETSAGQQEPKKTENIVEPKNSLEEAPKKIPNETSGKQQKPSVNEPKEKSTADTLTPKPNENKKKHDGTESKPEFSNGQKPGNDGKSVVESSDKTESSKTNTSGDRIKSSKTPQERFEIERAKMEQIGKQNALLTDKQIQEHAKSLLVTANECNNRVDKIIDKAKKLFANNGFNDKGEKIADITQSGKMTFMTSSYVVNGKSIKRQCRIRDGVLIDIQDFLQKDNEPRIMHIALDNGVKHSCKFYTNVFQANQGKMKCITFDSMGKIETYSNNCLISGFFVLDSEKLVFKNGIPAKLNIFSGEYKKAPYDKPPIYIEKLLGVV